MLIEGYLNRLRLSSFRPTTVDLRRRVLCHFQRHVAPTPLTEVTRLQVEGFLARDLSPGSRRVYRTALRSFFAWALEEGYVAADPTLKVPPVRVAAGVPRPVSEDDLARALSVADARMRSWLLLMSLAGLRCLEVAGLTPADLVRDAGGWRLELRVTKGGASATVPAHPRLVEVLHALPVYLDSRGVAFWWDVTPVTVSRQVGAHLRSCGVDATAHALRHTAATSWYRASGEDLLTTRRLMRHKSVSSTEVYAAVASTRTAEVVNAVRAAG